MSHSLINCSTVASDLNANSSPLIVNSSNNLANSNTKEFTSTTTGFSSGGGGGGNNPPDPNTRVKGVTIVKPIVYGNVARYFGKKRESDGHTHQWTVYIKSFENEDMSTYVKKVQFKLHDSYQNPNRILTKAPFELTETGWGEFEITIKLFFVEPAEKPVTIYHVLKLFETDSISKSITLRKQVISELYDEIVFIEPSYQLRDALVNCPKLILGPYRHETDFDEKRLSTINSLLSAKSKVKRELNEMKCKLNEIQLIVRKYKSELSKLD